MSLLDGPVENEKGGPPVPLVGAVIALLVIVLVFPNINGDATTGGGTVLTLPIFSLIVVLVFPNTNGAAPAGGGTVLIAAAALELALFRFPNTNVGVGVLEGGTVLVVDVLLIVDLDDAAAPNLNGIILAEGIGANTPDDGISDVVVCPGLTPKLNPSLGALVADDEAFCN